ncbi:CHY zinc finger protein [Sporosarcina sp. E16_8]|uniref:CHY zinc finger protein n=1 Tax=Sporosarcina sp. E16_8 TaxID=2789295 RepID=UPI001A910E0A|nr:CHY zinc finger protein [Sporosarcina sp. E16_8]MBO0589676.1 zinc ribbon domain-containing protein [Sporosarcina sp. E16_8]
MICSNCGHEQAQGKFCGKCGTKFEEVTVAYADDSVTERVAATQSEPIIPAPAQPAEPNIHVENLKKQSKMYSSYFMQQLKRPSLIYNRGEAEFTNGLISIILLGVLLSLSLYIFMGEIFGGYGPGFFSFFSSVLVFFLFAVGIVILSLFLSNKFFGPQHSFKTIISFYGAHLSPLLIAATVSLLLILLKSFTFGNLILSIVFMFAIFVLPLYLISFLLTKKPTGMDPLYGFLLYLVMFTVLFVIFMVILADSTIGGYIDELTQWY